jgi:hypothetical protein
MLLFRVCLVAYAILATVSAVKILFVGPGPLPEPALAYLRWWHTEPQSTVERAVGWIGLATVVISVISALSMTVYIRWGRPAFATCAAIAIAMEPLMDYPVLKTPGEYFLDSLLGVISGAIVVFAYWSRVSDGFAKNAP